MDCENCLPNRTSISNNIYQAYNLPETLYQRVRVDGKETIDKI